MVFGYTDEEIEEMGLAAAIRAVIRHFDMELRKMDRGIADRINRNEDIVKDLAYDIGKLEEKVK